MFDARSAIIISGAILVGRLLGHLAAEFTIYLFDLFNTFI